MLLTHLGFPIPFIRWIMCCISTVSFSVIINGSASNFFHVERGLRQGCPLSPLLFLLVMEGLSGLILQERIVGWLLGLKITDQCILSHLPFVDDVLIFISSGIWDLNTFYDIMQLFCTTTGMETNRTKSTITFSACSPQESRHAYQKFPFQSFQLDDKLKYLGFHINSHG